MVALGGRDSVDAGRAFAEEHGMTAQRVLFDEDAGTWQELGVPYQPAGILFDADGVALERWTGPFDQDEALELAQQANAATGR